MSYIQPEFVKSPKLRWALRNVIYTGGENSWSAANGVWDGNDALAIRWNGGRNSISYPKTDSTKGSHACWFIVPGELRDILRDYIANLPQKG